VTIAGLALGLAVAVEDTKTIESFVLRGADIDGRDRRGMTALQYAAMSLRSDCVRWQVMANINRRFVCVNLKELLTYLLTYLLNT